MHCYRVLLFCIVNILSISCLHAFNTEPEYDWVQFVRSQDSCSSEGLGVCADSKGNLYVRGDFIKRISFPNGPTFRLDKRESRGYFVAKYDKAGKFQWARKLGYNCFSILTRKSIYCDSDDNIIVAGEFRDTCSFGSTKFKSSGIWDIFIAKLDPNGNYLWARKIGGKYYDAAPRLIVGRKNDIYVSGFFMGKTKFGNEITIDSTLNDPEPAAFISKFDKNGVCKWVRVIDVYSDITGDGYKMAEDPDGNLLVTAYYMHKVGFDNQRVIIRSLGPKDYFLAKYSSSGDFLWARGEHANDTLLEADCKAIAVDSAGFIYVAGIHRDTIFVDDIRITGRRFNSFQVIKYTPNGKALWALTPLNDSTTVIPDDILIDNNNNFYLAGFFSGTLLFAPRISRISNSVDIFIGAFDSSGKCLWMKQAGGTQPESKVAIGFDGKSAGLFLTGNYSFSSRFDDYSISTDYIDMFLGRLSFGCEANSIEKHDFGDLRSFTLAGSAIQENRAIRLTQTIPAKAGAVWYNERLPFSNGFTTEFSIRFSQPHNDFDDGSLEGADGFAFVIQNESAKAHGSWGGGMGYQGFHQCLAIEVDLYNNSLTDKTKDPNGNHLAVTCVGKEAITSDHSLKSTLAVNPDIPLILSDSSIYYFKITYSGYNQKLMVYMSKSDDIYTDTLLVLDSFDLTEQLDINPGEGLFAGFTAATGTSYQNQDLLSWKLCNRSAMPLSTHVEYYEPQVMPIGNIISACPNPANGITNISYMMQSRGYGCLSIYNALGERIFEKNSWSDEPGLISVTWETGNIPSGIYFAVFRSENKVESMKIVVNK